MTIPAWWAEIKNFKPEIFDSPDEPGSGATHMDEAFVRALDAACTAAGIPFPVTSGYRSPAHNLAVGGASGSDHMYGMCADVSVYGLTNRFKLKKAAFAAGMRQFGTGDRIVHLGLDLTRPEMDGIYHPGIPGRWY